MRNSINKIGFIQTLVLIPLLVLTGNAFSQLSGSVSTGLDGPVVYKAKDSIVAYANSEIIRLYGQAYVEYQGISLEAERIEINIAKNEVTAQYGLDSLGNPFGKPLFKGEGEETRSDYIKYNFETSKGYVREVRAQQEEGYLHMAEAKIHPNKEIHLKNGKFTTCDLDTPHYHFKMTKAIIVPDERIVTGPIYMKLFKIPTPLAAPFAFLPNSDTKKSGVIIPYPVLPSEKVGFGLTNGGYYWPINDHLETKFLGSIYMSGMFSLENSTNYYKRYKYSGNTLLRYEYFRGRFYDTTQYGKWTVNWNHRQDAKAHPSITFDANINYQSDNNSKTTLQGLNNDFYNSQLNSAINLGYRWNLGNFGGTMALRNSLSQNSQTNLYTMELPTYQLSVSRFDLGDFRRNPIGTKWYENITVNYSMKAQNRIQATDSIFNADPINTIRDESLNGILQTALVQSNLRIFQGRVLFNPRITYNEIWNFQYEKLEYNSLEEELDTLSYNSFLSSRDLQVSGSLTSNFYGYYKLKVPAKTRFKHVMTSTVTGSYKPNLSLYEEVQINADGDTRYYSPFQNSLNKELGSSESARLSFRLANTLEMKKNNLKDTINESVKNRKLINLFNITGDYDFLKDSMNLSDLKFSMATARIMNTVGLQGNAVLSPYAYVDSNGIDLSMYAWQNSQGLGRFNSADAAITANFTNKKGRKRQQELNDQTSENANNNQLVNSNNFTDMQIPWKLNLSYNVRYSALSSSGAALEEKYSLVQTIKIDGDFNLGEKWKFTYATNFDLQADTYQEALTYYNLSIWRDLHCWEAYLVFGQNGPFSGNPVTTFLFRVNVKASMFQDIKVEVNRPPFFF